MNGIKRKISKLKEIFKEEGFLATLSHGIYYFLVKIGYFRDKWLYGKIIELRGNIGHLDGCRFNLDNPLFDTIVKSSFLQGTYEKDERKIIRRFLNPSLPVIELGASIGVVSCVTNKILKNSKDHVVVEANSNLIPILQKNRDLNNCSFKIINKASGYGATEVTFYVNEKFLSGSMQRATTKSISIPTITLAEIFKDYNFKYANLICDIEGGELDLITHEKELLAERVFQIILEVHPSVLGEEKVNYLRQELESVGFRKIRTGIYSTVIMFENSRVKENLLLK